MRQYDDKNPVVVWHEMEYGEASDIIVQFARQAEMPTSWLTMSRQTENLLRCHAKCVPVEVVGVAPVSA